MKARIVLLFVLSLTLLTTNVVANSVLTETATNKTLAGLPLHIQELNSKAIRVWVGDHISSTGTVAIETKDGLVIIDTTGNPEIDKKLRKVIADKFGRDDFKYLINTHAHSDHTFGNSVYKDCIIVGHELVEESMESQTGNQDEHIRWRTNRIAELETEIAALATDAPEAALLKERLVVTRLNLKVAEDGIDLTPPTLTFSDKLEFTLGETEFELCYIGGMHSASDIAILVPDHGLLMTGDTMSDVWLTDTPGCLASFMARPNVVHNFPLLLDNWNSLLARKDSIKHLVTGHWNGELTIDGFENRVKYVESLWEGTKKGVADGSTMDALLAAVNLEARFPELVNSPGCNQSNTYTTALEMWTELTDQRSAAQVLYDLINQDADEAEINRVVAQKESDSPEYYFIEASINNLGYRFLQQQKVEQAVSLFKINAEMYPESWNVYDSYAEALAAAGDTEAAIVNYEKSLELNPESPTGQESLDRIRTMASGS